MENYDRDRLREAQRVIDENNVDFVPMAREYLAELHSAIEELEKTESYDLHSAIDRLTAPVMEIKSNASMFNYPLAGLLSNLMLDFLEMLNALEIPEDRKKLDDEIFYIARLHHDRLQMVIDQKLQGMEAAHTHALELGEELLNACRAYFQKLAK